MTEEELRAELARTLCDHDGGPGWWERTADALLPVVRRYAAGELRAAISGLSTAYAPQQVEEWIDHWNARADALEADA